MDKEEMIRLLLERDEAGMDALLQQYSPLMRYVISPILPNAQDREDCLSECAMRVWEKISLFDPARGSWTAWLTALARNAALNRARRAHADSVEALDEETVSPDPTPEEQVLQQERQEAVRRAIEGLDPQERALFYRKYYYRQPTAQIAAELGLTQRAVEGRLYRLRQRLRNQLGGDGHD